jgi:hypothetical protein
MKHFSLGLEDCMDLSTQPSDAANVERKRMSQVRFSTVRFTIAMALASSAAMSQAALVTRTGLSTNASPASPATPGDVGTAGSPAWAKDQFLKLIDPQSVRTEGFEQFSVGETFQGTPRPPLAFAPTAGSTGTGTPAAGDLIPSPPLPAASSPPTQNPGRIADSSEGYAGRFNTTGGFNNGAWAAGKFWEATGDFDIEFASGVNALGFHLTDSNDFLGQLNLVLVDENGAETTIPDITGATGQSNGSLQFFGFVDDTRKYRRVRFDIQQEAGTAPLDYDVFGLDDLLIGVVKTDGPNPAPEPATLALTALGLCTLAATRRRKSLRT